jgi:glycosyltransferase involved in cell wall biosynthesis
MKIALVGLTHPFRGGIAHYTTLLCRALAKRHEVEFFALSRQYPELLFPGKTQIDASDATIRVDHQACIDSINPFTWFGTARRIARFRPELVVYSWWHPFFAPSFGTIAHLNRLRGIPSCFLCHNALPHESSRVDKLLARYAFSAARVFITHSRQDHDDVRALFPRASVHQNPHPTYDVFTDDEAPAADEARRKLGLEGKRLMLFFGFIREYKGLDVLLEAVERLPADEDYHLLVVGEFYEDKEKYAAALERLRERGQLTLVDSYVPNEEIPLYFAAADLVMIPYLSATQSGIVQIAYAFDRPVVATRVGGIPEVVRDGATGFLVEAGDAAALGEAARSYFLSADRAQMRAAIAEESYKYSWERMVETIERACDEMRSD